MTVNDVKWGSKEVGLTFVGIDFSSFNSFSSFRSLLLFYNMSSH